MIMDKANLILNYEKALNELFKALGLSASLCQFVRALIMASKGQKVFQVSQRELAGFYRKCTPETAKADVQSVKDKLKTLKKWESENKIQLVRITKEGSRRAKDGKYKFTDTEYELVGLSEFAGMLHSSSDQELETQIATAIENLKSQYKPIKKRNRVHPRALIKRAKKTIYTNFDRIFELWQKANEDSPVPYCQDIVDYLQKRLTDLEDDYIHAQNKKKRKAQFEALKASSKKSIRSRVDP